MLLFEHVEGRGTVDLLSASSLQVFHSHCHLTCRRNAVDNVEAGTATAPHRPHWVRSGKHVWGAALGEYGFIQESQSRAAYIEELAPGYC